MSLGENIRYLRLKNHMSQDELAEKLGYKSYTTIQKWESGVSEPPIKKLKDISLLFGVDMDTIMNDDIFRSVSLPSPPRLSSEDIKKILTSKTDGCVNIGAVYERRLAMINRLLAYVRGFNERGLERLVSSAEVLNKIDEYKEDS